MAHVLLKDLLNDNAALHNESAHVSEPDILLDLARVNKEIGNYEASIQVAQGVFQFAPRQLLKADGSLNLGDTDGVS
ncbi:MAG: hypothetical protein KDK78_02725, partial [Chlamydiia bacterium]|nr:hypothetical protein [Chlamydiia bacterium]